MPLDGEQRHLLHMSNTVQGSQHGKLCAGFGSAIVLVSFWAICKTAGLNAGTCSTHCLSGSNLCWQFPPFVAHCHTVSTCSGLENIVAMIIFAL